MSIFEIIMTYSISWFMVLFMVLPWGIKVPQTPGKGHAASAPENPQLKRKLLVTSALAIIPVILFGLGKHAMAETGIYHAGGGDVAAEKECVDYQTPDGVDADKDTAGPNNIRTGITVPTADYISDDQLADRIYTSETYIGSVDVDMKGNTKLNGKLIGNPKCKPK